MVVALLILAGIVLLALAGANVRGPRFSPEWYGFACLAAALLAPVLDARL